MKILIATARILLGLIFAFFGANLLFNFFKMPPPPPGPVRDYMTVMGESHYFYVIGIFQLIPGLLLLVNRYVPLALTALAAEIINILSTHILIMHGEGLVGLPILVVLLWILVFWSERTAFSGVFRAKG